MIVKIALAGLGKVGLEVLSILVEKREILKHEYNFDWSLVAVIGSKAGIVNPLGIDPSLLLTGALGSRAIEETGLADSRFRGFHGIVASDADVLIEATPTNIEDGEPGRKHIEIAASKKMNIVTLSKGPLVVAFEEIMKLCERSGVQIKFSGTTAAALPTIDLGQFSLAGCKIEGIHGILNGTTNYMLSKMMEEGLSFESCLQRAIEEGIAEKNHQLDTGGFDTASKILILANSLMDAKQSFKDVTIQGIDQITISMIEDAKKNHQVIKLVGSAVQKRDKVHIMVRPEFLNKSHLLAQVNNKDKGIIFETDLMGSITAIGGKSDPRAAAAAAVKDLINLYR